MFSVRLEGLDELVRTWRGSALGAVSDGIRKGVRLGVEEGAAEARTKHRHKDRTGNLTKKTQGRVITSTHGGAQGEIVAKTKYASFVEEGTKAHVIRPKPSNKRGVLAWRSGGGWVVARIVRHPGTRPYGFMGMAFQKAERVIEREVELGVERARRVMEQQ